MPAYLRLAGALGATLFWIAVFVTGALTPGYSHLGDMVSELGAVGAPYPWLINLFGIIPFALSTVLTGIWIMLDFRPGVLAWLSGIALGIGGLGFLLAGLAPCDVACRASELTSAKLHEFGSTLGFVLVPVGGLILGLRAFRYSRQRMAYSFSLLTALAIAISLSLFLNSLDSVSPLLGLWQRVTLLFISVFVAGLSVYLFRKRRSAAKLQRAPCAPAKPR